MSVLAAFCGLGAGIVVSHMLTQAVLSGLGREVVALRTLLLDTDRRYREANAKIIELEASDE